MITGKCHLCGKECELQDSHVWPKYAYKRFVSSKKKGGQFVDLAKKIYSNHQYKSYWFCKSCELFLSEGEKAAAEMSAKVTRNPDQTLEYNHLLIRFATSISWRTAKLDIERNPSLATPEILLVMNRWKGFLGGSKNTIRPFSQHLFVIADRGLGLDRLIGGQIYPSINCVVSQVGPLVIVGLMQRRGLILTELNAWGHSEIELNNGFVTPVKQWKVRGKDANIAQNLAQILGLREGHLVRKAIEFHKLLPTQPKNS